MQRYLLLKQMVHVHTYGGARGRGGMPHTYTRMTSTLDGGERSASRPGRDLPPGKEPPVSTGQEAGWAPEPV
jgi:hypothetical protein